MQLSSERQVQRWKFLYLSVLVGPFCWCAIFYLPCWNIWKSFANQWAHLLSKSPCLYINVGRVSEMRLCAVMNIFGIVPPNTKSGPSKSVLICDHKLQDPIGFCLLVFVFLFFVFVFFIPRMGLFYKLHIKSLNKAISFSKRRHIHI